MSLLHFLIQNRAALDNGYKRHVERAFSRGGYIRDEYLTKYAYDIYLRRLHEYALFIHPDATGIKIGNAPGQISELYSFNPEGDLIQTVGGSQPVVHEWRGENYWSNQGVTGNYVSTPNAVANQITGDLDLDAKIIKNGAGDIHGKWSNVSKGFFLSVLADSKPVLYYSLNGSTVLQAVSTAPVNETSVVHVRGTRVASTGVVKFFTSTDGTTWNQLGSDVLGTSGALFASTATVGVGGYSDLSNCKHKIYSARIYNGIRENGGTLAVNFDANDYRKSDPTDQSGWNASITGERWTINTDGNATGIKGVLVDGTKWQTDGIGHNMKTGVMTLNQPVSMYLPVNVLNGVAIIRGIYDGATANSGALKLYNINDLRIYNGAFVSYTFPNGNYKKAILISSVSNGSNSSININGSQVASGNGGGSNRGGVTVGSSGGSTEYINALYSTIIATRTADTPGQQADINSFINQLNKRLY